MARSCRGSGGSRSWSARRSPPPDATTRKRSDLVAITAELQVELQQLFDAAMASPATDPPRFGVSCGRQGDPNHAESMEWGRKQGVGPDGSELRREVGEDGRRVDGAVVGEGAARRARLQVDADRWRRAGPTSVGSSSRSSRGGGKYSSSSVTLTSSTPCTGARCSITCSTRSSGALAPAVTPTTDASPSAARSSSSGPSIRTTIGATRRSSRPWPARRCSTSWRCR